MRVTSLKAANPRNFPAARKVGSIGFVALLCVAGCARDSTAPLSTDVQRRADVVPAVSTYLIDTGPGATTGGSSVFSAGSTNCSPQPACASHFQYLGGKFTLANETNVESVEGWMSIAFGGSIAVHIRPDSVPPTGASLPKSTSVHSAAYTVTPQVAGWKVFSSFAVNLAAGTYWLTFEPVANSGLNGSMPGSAAAPLADYAFFADGNNRWVSFSLFGQNPALGFRIFGTQVVAPPPDTPEDMIAELRTIISDFGLAKGTAKSLDAMLRAALDAVSAGQTSVACASLRDLINYANAQSGKKLTASQASDVSAAATSIRTELGC